MSSVRAKKIFLPPRPADKDLQQQQMGWPLPDSSLPSKTPGPFAALRSI
jgi:hypothetical protein